jgi:hypothetical protein
VLLRAGNAGSNTASDHISVIRDALRQLPSGVLSATARRPADSPLPDRPYQQEGRPSREWYPATRATSAEPSHPDARISHQPGLTPGIMIGRTRTKDRG